MTVCVNIGVNEQACYPENPPQARVTFFTTGPGSIPPDELWVTLENANGPPMNPSVPNSFRAADIITPVQEGQATDIVQAVIDYYVASLPPPLP